MQAVGFAGGNDGANLELGFFQINVAAHPALAQATQAQGRVNLALLESDLDAQQLGHQIDSGAVLGGADGKRNLFAEFRLVSEVLQHAADEDSGSFKDAWRTLAAQDSLIELEVTAANLGVFVGKDLKFKSGCLEGAFSVSHVSSPAYIHCNWRAQLEGNAKQKFMERPITL